MGAQAPLAEAEARRTCCWRRGWGRGGRRRWRGGGGGGRRPFAPLFAPPPPPPADDAVVAVECSELDSVDLLDVVQIAIVEGDDAEDLDTALAAAHGVDDAAASDA